MKKKHFFVLLILSCIGLSCSEKENLNEIEIPEREYFIIEKSQFPDPTNIRTLQGPFDMPGLSYDFIEFNIVDPKTAFTHYQNYHLSYANALNTAIHNTEFEKEDIVDIIKKAKQDNQEIKELSSAYYNHNIYWKSLDPVNQTQPKEQILQAIENTYGTVDNFNKQFKQIALSNTGSGWTWLIKRPNNSLEIVYTAFNQNPLTTYPGSTILLAIDLWEHAYISTYPNDAKTYIDKCLNHLNWQYANEQYIKK